MSEIGYDTMDGYEEIGYDEMGRRVVRRKKTARNPNLPGQGGASLSADRLYPFPVQTAAAVGAALTATATGRPQATCKPVRYKIHVQVDNGGGAVAAAAWFVNFIQIGQRLQSIANGGVGGDIFGGTAVGVSIEFDTAQSNQDVTVNVTDQGGIGVGKTCFFKSTFLCKALHY